MNTPHENTTGPAIGRPEGVQVGPGYYTDQAAALDGMVDSGRRQTFPTGAVRDTETEKSRPDLISPWALDRLGHWLRRGAEKYAERNWEKGIPFSRCLGSLCRHLLAYQQCRTDEDHLAAILCNAMFLAHYEAMIQRGTLPAELDDRPHYRRQHPSAEVRRQVDQEETPPTAAELPAARVDHAVLRSAIRPGLAKRRDARAAPPGAAAP